MELSGGVYRVPPDVLATRPQTTAELWDSRLTAVPEQHRVAELQRDARRFVAPSVGPARETKAWTKEFAEWVSGRARAGVSFMDPAPANL
jgi:hypothetical protein